MAGNVYDMGQDMGGMNATYPYPLTLSYNKGTCEFEIWVNYIPDELKEYGDKLVVVLELASERKVYKRHKKVGKGGIIRKIPVKGGKWYMPRQSNNFNSPVYGDPQAGDVYNLCPLGLDAHLLHSREHRTIQSMTSRIEERNYAYVKVRAAFRIYMNATYHRPYVGELLENDVRGAEIESKYYGGVSWSNEIKVLFHELP